ncbi:MAG: single-stranded-DNA-specific exonuclease RecJ, partial [Alphaproteobacteria bacterium]|nr:single-stranded-DNA-specific exonuclease RecJ [Alphaproteobacteria bacterium]
RAGLAIAQKLGVNELVGRLLAARGIDAEQAADFLAPTLRSLLPDPSVLEGMDAAAARLADAVAAREPIAIFGDYDVDGACSAALLTEYLRAAGAEVLAPYIPDRIAEGYGPNLAAFETLLGRGARVIVCVDCGTLAHEPLGAVANRADVIVLDHHEAEPALPPARAIVNPNRLDDRSRLGHLAACGVTFLAVVALNRELRRRGWFEGRAEPDLFGFLDLVALATVADVVPLAGVNRAFVAQGLKVLAQRRRAGLAALCDVAALREAPTAWHLGFVLGPRVNAGGRVGEADLGVRLLLAEDPVGARALAERMEVLNRSRQEIEAGVLAAAMSEGEAQSAAGLPVLLVAGEGWHPGVVGIVASRLKERFNRPALCAGIGPGEAKGSARSVPGVDIGAALIAARQAGLVAKAGGHPMAAGFSLEPGRLPALHAFLNERAAPIAAALAEPAALMIDGTLAPAAATAAFAEQVAGLAPFGIGNDEPVFVVSRARATMVRSVGREGAHLSLQLSGMEGGGRLKAIAFRAAGRPLGALLQGADGRTLHLAGHLRAETWQSAVNASLQVTDAAPTEGS